MNAWLSSACKVIEWTRVLWAGSMLRKWTNTTVKRVSDDLSSVPVFPVSAVHHVLVPPVLPDYKDGFGGSFGVQKDRVDKSAVGWEHHEKVDKHESQTGIGPE